MKLEITRASLICVEKIVQLFNAYRGFYGQLPNLAESGDFLAQRITHNESAIFYASDEHGEALGFVQLYPIFSSVLARKIWLLNDLFAADSARGKGVGTALLAAAKEFVISTGAKGILLETGRENKGAQRLYEAHGYVRDINYYTYYLDLA